MRVADPGTGLIEIALRVNDAQQHLHVAASATLLDILRDELDYTGAKLSCDEQRCGACTVLVGGLPVSACNYLAYETDGKEILTIEGLGANGELDTLQRTFIEGGAVQCGFCTPGMIMTARALLNDSEAPTDQQVRDALIGNLCRCTGYDAIVKAVVRAGKLESDA